MVTLSASGAAVVAAAKAAEPPPYCNLSMRLTMIQVERNEPIITRRLVRLLEFTQLESGNKQCSAEAIIQKVRLIPKLLTIRCRILELGAI